MVSEQDIPQAELDAAFKNLKKNANAFIMKVYDDGGVKIIDNQGVVTVFDTYQEFLKYARTFEY